MQVKAYPWLLLSSADATPCNWQKILGFCLVFKTWTCIQGIERISRDETLISDILRALTLLWMNVIAREVFEMRVPRDLLPVILPQENNYPTTYTSLSNPNASSIRHHSNNNNNHKNNNNKLY